MAVVYETICEEDMELGTGATAAEKTMPGGGTAAGTKINLATFAIGPTMGTWDPASIADGDLASTTVTVTGAALGDYALASFSLTLGGLILSAYVSATNTVTCALLNNTGGAVNLGSGTLSVLVFKVA